jgi:hypothetical protein
MTTEGDDKPTGKDMLDWLEHLISIGIKTTSGTKYACIPLPVNKSNPIVIIDERALPKGVIASIREPENQKVTSGYLADFSIEQFCVAKKRRNEQ